MFFADDLVLFTEASMEQVVLLEQVFQTFCDSSRQKISKEKSVIYVSHNVKHDKAKALGDGMGVVVTKDLGRYLGVPNINGRVTKRTYGYIVDKMRKRISDWNNRWLSMAGRLVLNQSVLSAAPIFTMQTTMLPKTTCLKLTE